jgi:hypothetical protein
MKSVTSPPTHYQFLNGHLPVNCVLSYSWRIFFSSRSLL